MQYKLDTKLEDLELAPKLETRLKLCKAETFGDVMAINPAEWANVTPKVVNALRRFQSANRQLYISLGGKPVQRNEGRGRRRGAQDEQRFFAANNILNAYAAAGMLFGGERPVEDVMAEIVSAADAFMSAFTASNEAAVQDVEESEHDADTLAQEAGPLTKGDTIILTGYLGQHKTTSKVLAVGCIVNVVGVVETDDEVIIRGRVDGKDVRFKAKQWTWDVVK